MNRHCRYHNGHGLSEFAAVQGRKQRALQRVSAVREKAEAELQDVRASNRRFAQLMDDIVQVSRSRNSIGDHYYSALATNQRKT